jgi:hypothetical protein
VGSIDRLALVATGDDLARPKSSSFAPALVN